MIYLTGGHVTLIDPEDVDVARKLTWHADASRKTHYAASFSERNSNEKCLKAHLHRLLMGCPDGLVVDHINGDGLDNRRVNLRICTRTQNGQNRRSSKNGIEFKKNCPKNPYMALITVAKEKICLGYFPTYERALQARKEAQREYFGEFAPK